MYDFRTLRPPEKAVNFFSGEYRSEKLIPSFSLVLFLSACGHSGPLPAQMNMSLRRNDIGEAKKSLCPQIFIRTVLPRCSKQWSREAFCI
jgi:hypothetical protein